MTQNEKLSRKTFLLRNRVSKIPNSRDVKVQFFSICRGRRTNVFDSTKKSFIFQRYFLSTKTFFSRKYPTNRVGPFVKAPTSFKTVIDAITTSRIHVISEKVSKENGVQTLRNSVRGSLMTHASSSQKKETTLSL